MNGPANAAHKFDVARLLLQLKSLVVQGLEQLLCTFEEQLAQFRRPPKVLVAARIDREVYEWLMQYGPGYSTRINRILRTVMERAR